MYQPEKYWDSRFSKGFNLEAVGFDSFGKSFNRWQYKMKRKVLGDVIEEYGLYDKRVLDVGCGTGFYVDIWKQKGIKDLAGIDISSRSVEELSKRYTEYRFYQVDVSAVTLVGEPFDIITAFDVLFHIVDDSKFGWAIWDIGKLCRRNGLVLITDSFPRFMPYVLNHQKSRTLEEYKKVLSDAKLSIEKRIPIHFFLNAPLDIRNRSLAMFWWKYIVGGLELSTHLMGALFYYLDSVLMKWFKESPSTEMLICRKSS